MPGALFSAGTSPVARQSGLEPKVKEVLMNQCGLRIERLVVRRTPDGLCLDGVIQVSDGDVDIGSLVRTAMDVGEVLNRLVVYREEPATRLVSGADLGAPETWQG